MTCRSKTHNKYGARKATVDGETFDSLKEAKRYQELRLLEKAGAILNLKRQVPYELLPAQHIGNTKERAVHYVADFVYIQNGETVVEDVKGCKHGTAYALFAIKRKLMLSVYGIHVKEV